MGRKSLAKVRKAEILDHFYRVLTKEGFEGASIAKIARSMGTYPGHITHYFSTKEEMLIELVTSLLDSYAKLVPGWEKIKDPEKRMDHILKTIFSPDWSNLADNRVYYACYYLSLANPEIHTLFKDFYHQFKDILTNEIQKYLDSSGAVKYPQKDPETIAHAIIAIMSGVGIYNNIVDDKNRVEAAGQFARQAVINLLKNPVTL